MSDLRDVIARAIYASDFDIPAEELEEQWAWSGARSSYQNNADAVLAVLADPPAEVIERATNAVHASLLDECGAGSSLLYCAPEADSDGFLEVQGAVDLPHLVRDLLRAAFGGEQA